MQQILGLREPCFRLAEHRHEESKSNYKELFVFQGMPEGGQVSGPVLKLAMTSEIGLKALVSYAEFLKIKKKAELYDLLTSEQKKTNASRTCSEIDGGGATDLSQPVTKPLSVIDKSADKSVINSEVSDQNNVSKIKETSPDTSVEQRSIDLTPTGEVIEAQRPSSPQISSAPWYYIGP